MKKRLLSLLLVCCAAVLLFAALPVTAQAETEGDWEYSVSSGMATVTKYNGTDAVVTIPDTFGLYQVTSIGNSAFEGNVTLTQINFPKGLTSIGNKAFKGCVGLKEVTLPAKLTTLGARAFENCTWLTKVTIQCTSLNDIKEEHNQYGQPFYGAGTAGDGIAVVFADGCTRVPRYLFHAHDGAASAANVTSVTMADSVTWVGGLSFRGCVNLKTVDLGNGVDYLGNQSFEGCTGLQTVNFSNKLTTIGEYTFKNCSALKDVTLPDSLTSIGIYAFEACISFKSITLPEKLANLGARAFQNCTQVSKITLNCTALNNIKEEYSAYGQPFYGVGSATDGVTVEFAEGCTRVPNNLFHARDGAASAANVTSVTIADSVKEVGAAAFRGCVYLQTVDFGNGVTNIGDSSFYDCSSLTSVKFPNVLTTISNYAFVNCGKLQNVDFPDSLLSIGTSAFVDCFAFTEVTLPEKLVTLSARVFQGCTGIKKITVNSVSLNNIKEEYSLYGQPFYAAGTAEVGIEVIFGDGCTRVPANLFHGRDGSAYVANITSVTMADTVTEVGSNAFRGCVYLQTVDFGKGVTNIGDSAFYDCSSLEKVTFSDTLTTISNYAFVNCGKLQNVDFPDSLLSIGTSAFVDCFAFTEVTLPEKLVTLSARVFQGCTGIKKVTVESVSLNNIKEEYSLYGQPFHGAGTAEVGIEVIFADGCTRVPNNLFHGRDGASHVANITSVSMADTVKEVGSNAFRGCVYLQTVDFGNGVTNIGDSAFYDCSSLEKVTFSDALTTISNYAFVNCGKLQNVDFPDSLLSIGTSAFVDCFAFTEVTLPEKLVTLSARVFQGCTGIKKITVNSVSLNNIKEEYSLYGQPFYAAGTAEVGIEVIFGDGCTRIPANLFHGRDGLSYAPAVKSVTVADTVTEVGNNAFTNCGELKTIKFLGSNPTIGGNSFGGVVATGYHPGWPEEALQNYGGTITWIGEKPACTHAETTVQNAKAATCTAEGYTGDTVCASCGETLEAGEPIPMTDHTEEILPAVAPTCKDTGLTEGKKCSVCGETLVKQETVPVTDHTWDAGKITTEATPDAPGVKTFTCTVCQITRTEEVPFSCEHNADTETKLVNQKDADCTTEGYTGDTVCANCGEVLTKGEIIPAKGHTEDVIPAVAPTCKDTGLTEGKKCSVCGETLVKQETVPVTDHTWDAGKITTEATPDAPGVKTFTCTVCGETKTEPVVFNCTHTTNPETKVVNQKDATCAEEGYTGDTVCVNCGEVLSKGEVIPKTDHTWDKGKVTTEATPEKPGVKTFTCTVCQATKTEEIRYVNPDIPPVPELPEEPVEDTSIFRIAGDNRFETAFMVANQMKENLGVEKFNAIIVASGTNFADALSGSYLAAVKQAPILLSYNEEFNDQAKNYIRENLADGGIVYILGGEKAVPESMRNGLEGIEIKRLAGVDRFGTNLAILEEAGVGDKPILVCTGIEFADSLSGSATELPILLVWRSLTDDQKAFLSGLSGNKLYIIGGESAVSKDMQLEVGEYGATKRLGGKNRFETSVMIAKEFFTEPEPESVVLAYAWNYPDGLCGGALASTMKAPLILTMTKWEAEAKAYAEEAGIGEGVVLGGTGLISDDSVRLICGMK